MRLRAFLGPHAGHLCDAGLRVLRRMDGNLTSLTVEITMRFRPRFSIRTLAIFVTLVCVYFGAWEATKKWGVSKIFPQEESEQELDLPFVIDASSPVAMVVVQDELVADPLYVFRRRFYLWYGISKLMLFEMEDWNEL